MLSLQHNKTIVVDGPKGQRVVCGSTNMSWRGLFVQDNNAIVLEGETPVKLFQDAFDAYWAGPAKKFGTTEPADMHSLGLDGIDAQVAFSPHGDSNALLDSIGQDIATHTTSSLFFSLAFLYETSGAIRDAITQVHADNTIFVCGISDRKVGGLDVTIPDGNTAVVYPSALGKNLPEPFHSEPTGGTGTRLHHKFVVIDFDKPSARVYMGSYNFSSPADVKNGENLLLIKDRRIAVAYVVEALRIFDHYQFRVVEQTAKKAKTKLELKKPPRSPGRDRLVGGGLHRRQKDPRSGAVRVSSKDFPTDTKGGEFALDDLDRWLAGPRMAERHMPCLARLSGNSRKTREAAAGRPAGLTVSRQQLQ